MPEAYPFVVLGDVRRARDGGAIYVHGSANLVQNLATAGLVDRYNLLVFPLMLGSGGKRLFADATERASGQSAASLNRSWSRAPRSPTKFVA